MTTIITEKYGNFGLDSNGNPTPYNIWSNMDFIFNPVTTKKEIREIKKAETLKKIEEENKKRNEEFEIALKNLEDLKKQYLNTTKEQNSNKNPNDKPKQNKKTPRGKK